MDEQEEITTSEDTIEAIKDNMEIVPYTETDRRLNLFIFIIVSCNLLLLISLLIPWGQLGL